MKYYLDADLPWLTRELKNVLRKDCYQRCNNTDGEPRNGAIDLSRAALFSYRLCMTRTTTFLFRRAD